MLPYITICAPIRDRAWVLPLYLRRIAALNYPKDRLGVFWVTHDNTDSTATLLKEFYGGISDKCICQLNLGKTPKYYDKSTLRTATNRDEVFEVLAYLRNHLFANKPTRTDYMFSIDSDVLVYPNILHDLLAVADERTIVSGLIKNSPSSGIYNYMYYKPEQDAFTRDSLLTGIGEKPFCVGLAGAVTLYPKRVCEIGRFSVCKSGEDEGLARSLMGHNIVYKVHPKAKCTHVMSPTCELRW